MRFLKLLFLSAALSVAFMVPAGAGPAETTSAAQALQQALGNTKVISSGEGPEVLQALEAAAISKPDLLGEIAALVAVARPELVADIKKSIRLLAPQNAAAVIRFMEQASINPSVDQLAALAALEGISPASGSSFSSDSQQERGVDLGWAGYSSSNGSPD